MGIDLDNLVRDTLKLNADNAAIVDTSKIKFHEDYRKACEKNACGNYNTNWMGPPAVGPISELIKGVQQYKKGLLIQSIHKLSNSFDWDGMMSSAKNHEKIFRNILQVIKIKYRLNHILPLNAGCCRICERCTYLDGEACRYPDRALSSIEAYGIDVISLEKDVGISYYNGLNTVSYVGLILFNE